MKQQISLYSFSQDIENLWLNYSKMVQLTLMFAGFLMVITSTVVWQNVSNKRELSRIGLQMRDVFARATTANKKLDVALGNLKEKEIYDKYKTAYDTKFTQYETLKNNGIVQGFKISDFLDVLAYNTVFGLWLNKINVANYGAVITLNGTSMDDKLVPVLASKVESPKFLTGKVFHTFNVAKDEKLNQQIFTLNITHNIN